MFFMFEYDEKRAFPMDQRVKTRLQCRRYRRHGFVPGSGRSPGGAPGNPCQYSCLENPMGLDAWWAIVQKVTESDTTELLSSYVTYERVTSELNIRPETIKRLKRNTGGTLFDIVFSNIFLICLK